MSIGYLASASGVKVTTIRFYEDAGVLPKPSRTPSGRRSYGPDDLQRLRFVRGARALGFDLDEVRSLLALAADRKGDCAEVYAIALCHLREVETKIERLALLRDELTRISALCAGGQVSGCRVLEALGSSPDHPR
ncbi:MAG: transcriptional regulator [Sphingomonadales bacterium 32-68-7]|nr:MAG: transcriptional regulator [Sphingomonadales bacterium 12-68-11]OYX10118.1 MAG: transcriptional regulator [Sphingomonadales bacterium 32-68-7]